MKNIRFLKRKEIEELKWNRAIDSATNSLPYAFSWYLDVVAENWGALILDDYAAVMPLVWLRKFGVKCLYQPYYCQQLGIFSTMVLPEQLVTDFILQASEMFFYIDINLNPIVANQVTGFSFKAKKNLLLPLDKEYAVLRKEYSINHLRNISKAEKGGLSISEKTDLKKFQEFYLSNINPKEENYKKKHEEIFRKLTDALLKKNAAKVFAVVDGKSTVLAAAMMIFHQHRIINIINTSSVAGKKMGASHFIFDNIIAKYAESSSYIDFEGSSIPGIARFYEGFGAIEETFYNYRKISLKLGNAGTNTMK